EAGPACRSSRQPLVRVADDAGMVGPGELCGPRQPGRQRRQLMWISKRPADAGDPGLDVAGRQVLDRVAADLAQHGQVAREHRRAARERLDDRQAKSLSVARQQHHRGRAAERGNLRARQAFAANDRALEVLLGDDCLLLAAEWLADLYESYRGELAPYSGEDSQQQVDGLAP